MKKTYKNRNGQSIEFELQTNGLSHVVKVSGFEWYRTGYNTDTNQIDFFDPDGGPFIRVGDDISSYLDTDVKMQVKAIVNSESGFLLTIKTF